MPEEQFAQKWRALASRINQDVKVPFPRWIGITKFEQISLHCFTDASERALGVVIYLVAGQNSVFYASKSKVCTTKHAYFSIPRKELTAISLGVGFIRFAFEAISKYFIPQCHLWSDSTTALNWLNSNTEHKDLFIRDRVNDLARKSKLGEKEIIFHYVVSEINPGFTHKG